MSTLEKTTVFGIFHKMALPEGATPVADFVLDKYLGRWYEVARMNFFWEQESMSNVYAEYRRNDEGTVDVLNTGYREKKEKWSSWEGEARFRTENTVAALEVSFFGPVWSGYNVVSVDEDYTYALVFGSSTDYLWFLSRERTMPDAIKDKYLKMAKDIGYDLGEIHYTEQNRDIPPFEW